MTEEEVKERFITVKNEGSDDEDDEDEDFDQ
jgi:hypothetical protein